MDNTFGIDIIPDNDVQRIEALKRYKILDTPPEHSFDNLAKLAARIFKVPVSLISLVDAEQVYFKANIGMGKATGAARGVSLCSLAVLNPEVTVFENAPEEPCLLSNPNVAGKFGLKFYAGAPITTPDGFLIGTLCIIDQKPRTFSGEDREILKRLAGVVMDEIELRLSSIEEAEKLQLHIEEIAAINEELRTSNEELVHTELILHNSINALSLSEARAKYMIADAPVAIGVLTGTALIVESANTKILELWGKTNTVINQPLHIALPELEGQPFLGILKNVLLSNTPFFGNELKAFLVRNGRLEEAYFNFVYHPVKDSSGQAASIMIVATEVTEQIRYRQEIEDLNHQLAAINEEISSTNEELLSANLELKAVQEDLLGTNTLLAASEELKNIAIEQAKLGIWYQDTLSKKVIFSNRLKEFFGYYTDEEMSYEATIAQIREDYRDNVVREMELAIANGRSYDMEYPVVEFRSKQLRWLRATGKLNPALNGKEAYFSGTMIDITEQKEDDQRKNDFISMVSHELKTPLTSMNGYIQILALKAASNADTFAASVLERAGKQTKKMTTMINGFLNMKRMETGKIPIYKSVFDMAELVRETEEETIATISSHRVIFAPVARTFLEADRDKIGQVINNLISNAVKYSAEGSTIHVACTGKGNTVQVSVKDEGMGISEHDQARLFDRFYRVERKEMETIAGFGIGLYLCDEIVRRHGGKIWVESVLQAGSTFHFNLPC
ncbi:ATP-binding protein [Pedobacter sp. AW31-3R]|uniref:ATP-binding protein n=1 Tax=Pedobacter sp. AW31-3R TaxID=3445781 RepID=UPI003F9FEA22